MFSSTGFLNLMALLIEDFRMDKIGNMYEEQLLSTVTPSQENISWFDREL